MSLLGTVAFALFVVFPIYPLIFVGRLAFGARARAPLLLIAFHLQAFSFAALSAWFMWMARPVLAPVADAGLGGALPPPTLFFIVLSGLLRTLPGALAGLLAAGALLRGSGKWLASRWRDASVPVWRIDAAALMAWMVMSAALSLELFALLVPLMAILD